MILDAKKIAYNKLDISADETLKKNMREIVGDPKALPPQLANGKQYCGVRWVIVGACDWVDYWLVKI